MSDCDARARGSAIEAIIPRPPADVAPMRAACALMVSRQWQTYVRTALRDCKEGVDRSHLAKGRFIGEMYARAWYSMLLVSHCGPTVLRVPVRASALFSQSRRLTQRASHWFDQ